MIAHLLVIVVSGKMRCRRRYETAHSECAVAEKSLQSEPVGFQVAPGQQTAAFRIRRHCRHDDFDVLGADFVPIQGRQKVPGN